MVIESLPENQPHPQEGEEEENNAGMTKRGSSINYIQSLRSREWCNDKGNIKEPNIFRDYHLRAFDFVEHCSISDLVIARDILFVTYNQLYLVPFRLDGEISPLTDQQGKPIIMKMHIIFIMCYNSHKNSLIVAVVSPENGDPMESLVSLDIASIEAGHTIEQRELFPPDSWSCWEFDIPNCRGMVHSKDGRVFKFFDLKEYKELYTIRDESDDCLSSDFGFEVQEIGRC